MVDGVDLLRQIDLIDGHAVFAVSSSTGLRRPNVEWLRFSLGTHRRCETLLGRDRLRHPTVFGDVTQALQSLCSTSVRLTRPQSVLSNTEAVE
jgi:hypothetical protein